MKIFGICSLILASVCCFFVLVSFIEAWFKRDKNIKWFDISKLNSEELIKNVFEYIDEAKDD